MAEAAVTPHPKAPHPRSLDDVDAELEEAIQRFRSRIEHVAKGRVTLTVERLGRLTVDYHVDSDPMTTREVARVMQEVPRKEHTCSR